MMSLDFKGSPHPGTNDVPDPSFEKDTSDLILAIFRWRTVPYGLLAPLLHPAKRLLEILFFS